MLYKVLDWVWHEANQHAENTGLEAVVRRGYEMVAKVSLILAAPSGVRTAEHIRWAFALVRNDIITKVNLVESNDEDRGADPQKVLRAKILERISDEHGESVSMLANRIRGFKRPAIEKMIGKLIESGEVVAREGADKRAATKFFRE